MGYNYIEAFQPEEGNNTEESNIENIQESALELSSFEKHLKDFTHSLQTKLSKEDPEVIFLAEAQIRREFYATQYNQTDDLIDYLQEKSEQLIESPNSNSPEILTERKRYTDQIKTLLDIQAEIKMAMQEAEEDRETGALMSQAKHIRAHQIVATIRKEIDAFLETSPEELN